MMPNRFTRACLALSAAAVATASIGLSAGTASAATHAKRGTVACGFACINVYSDVLGSSVTINAYVPGDNGTGYKIGQKVNLHLAVNNRPNGDFSLTTSGRVFQFCGILFSPTSYICLNYPLFEVFELAFAPFGHQTGLCAGVATAGVDGENVTLQTCGAGPNTAWVLDRANSTLGTDCRIGTGPPVSPGDPTVNFCPWLNGGDTNFSDPLVMTLDTGTTGPTNQLKIERELLNNLFVAATEQQFTFYFGAIP
jgi:hypothetical protein